MKIEIVNARVSDKNAEYVDYLYGRLQREGGTVTLLDVGRILGALGGPVEAGGGN